MGRSNTVDLPAYTLHIYIFFLSMDPITVLTVFMAFAMMFGIGYFMSAMAAIEEEQLREKQPRQYKPRPPSR